ncbi:MAG: hypothetical protein L6V86_09650 [Treponema sp.]|nr:MAG: hypothetical protein L6V86_09650 [Treponema sp.]
MYNRRESEIDMNSVAAFLQDSVEKVKTQENLDLLTELKKVFKKNVPLTLRNYVAAYLVKETVSIFMALTVRARTTTAIIKRHSGTEMFANRRFLKIRWKKDSRVRAFRLILSWRRLFLSVLDETAVFSRAI